MMTLCLPLWNVFAQGWSFMGPDSVEWRDVNQIDGSFHQGNPTRIAAGTSKGIVAWSGNQLKYVLSNQIINWTHSILYREVYYSPWNDSVAYIKVDEPLEKWADSHFSTISNTYSDTLWSELYSVSICHAAWDGFIAYPPHDTNRVYILTLCGLSITTDNGKDWSNIIEKKYFVGYFLSADYKSDSILYYAGNIYDSDSNQTYSGLFASKDHGSTWDSIANIPGSFVYAKMLARRNTFILGTAQYSNPNAASGIYFSTDRGKAWEQKLSNLNVNALIRDKIHPQHIYAVTSNGIYRSYDEGNTWRVYNNTLPTKKLRDIVKDPYSDTLYVATDMGVYKVFDKVVTGIEEDQNQLPVFFTLFQNYPNPFNPTTTLSFSLERSSFISLKIYDVFGREVRTLVNQYLPAGYKSAAFEAGNLSSGVYFYRLQAGTFVDVKKMLLMK